MSLTARPCHNCGDSIFADDPHHCIAENQPITKASKFPVADHWAILMMPTQDPKGVYGGSCEYFAFFSEASWKGKITELKQAGIPYEFVAFKASGKAVIKPNYSVNINLPPH